jgi:ferredoxin-NADP reductase
MAGTAVRGRLNVWQIVTVAAVSAETFRARTLRLSVPEWAGHRAGQHVDVRLTAEDGYQAERAYSIASAPGETLAITVERVDDGEVSSWLTQEARPGDLMEVRGPIGGMLIEVFGAVVRCRSCPAVLMTFVRIRDVTCVDLEGLASLG